MSNLEAIDLPEVEPEIVDANIREWVESARANPVLYRDRQVTEIVLAAIGITPTLQTTLVMKGGAVMALAFKSNRVTGDVDFSASAEPADFDRLVADELNAAMPKVAVQLGYVDLVCRVQTVKKMPRPRDFEDADFPALLVRIASAERGGSEQRRLEEGKASRVLDIEISFRDQVYAFQELTLNDAGVSVRAFTFHELIAEKLRALLQQPIRNRNRRQDVYDIAYLIEGRELYDEDRRIIHETLVEKCRTRDIEPTAESILDDEVRRRAQVDWNTLALEIGELPSFEERYPLVLDLYASLPWSIPSPKDDA